MEQKIEKNKINEEKKIADAQEKREEQKTTEEKKPETKNKKIAKKTEAVVNIRNAPISTKFSMAICKFIKYKEIGKAINELEQVLVYKKAIPMKGGVGHKSSAGRFASGSGKYPINAAKYFIKLLKSLSANASANGIENPIIVEAFGNIGQQQRARFGKWERKSTHLRLIAKDEQKTYPKEGHKYPKEGHKGNFLTNLPSRKNQINKIKPK